MVDYTVLILWWMGILAFFYIPSWVCSNVAKRKGLSGNGFFLLSLFFTPVVGFLAVIAFPCKMINTPRCIKNQQNKGEEQ